MRGLGTRRLEGREGGGEGGGWFGRAGVGTSKGRQGWRGTGVEGDTLEDKGRKGWRGPPQNPQKGGVEGDTLEDTRRLEGRRFQSRRDGGINPKPYSEG